MFTFLFKHTVRLASQTLVQSCHLIQANKKQLYANLSLWTELFTLDALPFISTPQLLTPTYMNLFYWQHVSWCQIWTCFFYVEQNFLSKICIASEPIHRWIWWQSWFSLFYKNNIASKAMINCSLILQPQVFTSETQKSTITLQFLNHIVSQECSSPSRLFIRPHTRHAGTQEIWGRGNKPSLTFILLT